MPAKIIAGPILGLESDAEYTVCCLVSIEAPEVKVVVNGIEYPANKIKDTPSGGFWRASFTVAIEDAGRSIKYSLKSGSDQLLDPRNRSEWTFWIPGKSQEPRIVYTSCNGFSDGNAKSSLDDPYAMWKKMANDHEKDPFALMIMGGDQIYADEIWHSRQRTPTIGEWSRLSLAERINTPATPELTSELDRFYEGLYIRHWNQPEMSLMMASIPSIMMWDDHDIFDGWGSYPSELHNCPVYQAIFDAARQYFELFQIRSKENTTLLRQTGPHYSFATLFRGYAILGLDNRTNRTENMIMNEENWSDVKGWLNNQSGKIKTLLVLSGVPVVYRDYKTTEAVFDTTPWQEELTDDIRDHWRSRYHEGERMKLIMNLLAFKPSEGTGVIKRVILSGDVHVGCMGVIRDNTDAQGQRLIHQVVSSAIVHPAPSWLAWLGITAGSNDAPESLDGGKIVAELLTPYGSSKFIRSRNYCCLKEGSDDKLWVTWTCENGATPEFPIVPSA